MDRPDTEISVGRYAVGGISRCGHHPAYATTVESLIGNAAEVAAGEYRRISKAERRSAALRALALAWTLMDADDMDDSPDSQLRNRIGHLHNDLRERAQQVWPAEHPD